MLLAIRPQYEDVTLYATGYATRTTEVMYSDDMYCSSMNVFRRVGRIFYLLNEKKITEESNKQEVLGLTL